MTDILGGEFLGRRKECNRRGGIDDSLLFFFLILVMIFCDCNMFGGDRC